MFNTYADAAPSAADDRKAELQDKELWSAFNDIKHRLSKPEAAARFLYDHEPDLSAFVAAMAGGDWLAASIEFDKVLLKQAEWEMGL